jgi:predicted Rossmann fold flavoprotein
MDQADVVVLGGGAAGLMCAATAGARGRRVRVLECANRVGKKILMSGGGRCNFTNTGTTPAQFLSANPHFCKSALARYTPADFIALVDRHGIAWHEKELGQLFCDDSAKQIVAMLLAECSDAGVRVDTGCETTGVKARDGGGFELATSNGNVHCESLVIATGGLSIPSLGGSSFGYALARQFGHALLPTRAALVPITLSGRPLEFFDGLAGVSLPVIARSGGTAFAHAMLVTHRGISGPAILQLSSYWEPGLELRLDLLAGQDPHAALAALQKAHPAAELRNALGELLPRRLAERLCDAVFGSKPMRQLDHAELRSIATQLADWPIVASGTEGYRTAEVTLGGVDTRELSSQTMASRHVSGLYFVGEVVDVTGWLGGYNFQWAWASGHAAGEVA